MQAREARALAQEESEVLPPDAPDIVDEELETIESSSIPCDPVVEDSLSLIQHKDEYHSKPDNSHFSPRNKVNGKINVDDGTAYLGEHGESKYAAVISNSVSYYSFSLYNLGLVCYLLSELVDVFESVAQCENKMPWIILAYFSKIKLQMQCKCSTLTK